jgi:hypothetical protein
MYLTDNFGNPTKWQVPSGYPTQTTVPAHGFILFWADDETSEGPLHTSFKLSADGEEIGLFLDEDTMIDGIVFGAQVQNISYGRYPDASDNLQFFAVPTPLADNNGTYYGFVQEIEVSHERGFYESAFDLFLSCDTNGATIRYTLDGTLPTETVGTVYTTGVGIPITTTTSLRAVAYKAGDKPSRTPTSSSMMLPSSRIIRPAGRATGATIQRSTVMTEMATALSPPTTRWTRG